MGDPAGVGPELCLQLFGPGAPAFDCDLTIFGSQDVLATAASHTQKFFQGAINDFGPLADLTPGAISSETGAASYRYFLEAIHATMAGDYDGVVTCPISKEALSLAGINYPGHTEILADETKAEGHCMMLTSGEITCSLVTTHCAISEVPKLLTTDRILETISLTADAMQQMRGRRPRLTILGLNPHAGETGLFGSEEKTVIEPAIAQARASGIEVSDPLPPDTAFIPSIREKTDAYICMYHDQGLIPLKTLAFETAVNITLGLPIVRTSVDHGTALDIAWQGKANPSSLYEAVHLAQKLASGRNQSSRNSDN